MWWFTIKLRSWINDFSTELFMDVPVWWKFGRKGGFVRWNPVWHVSFFQILSSSYPEFCLINDGVVSLKTPFIIQITACFPRVINFPWFLPDFPRIFPNSKSPHFFQTQIKLTASRDLYQIINYLTPTIDRCVC